MISEVEQSCESDLEHLLGESLGDAREREQLAFERAAAVSGRKIVIYGAGNLGQKVLLGLKQAERCVERKRRSWWVRPDSNREPIDYEPIALTS